MLNSRSVCFNLTLVVLMCLGTVFSLGSQSSFSSQGEGRILAPGKAGPQLKVAGMPSLSGEKATSYLKQEGSYDSLGEAMTMARYGVNWVNHPRLKGLGGAYEAQNPAQGFTAYFTPEGVSLMSAVGNEPGWTVGMKLQGIGYGDQLGEIASGTPSVKDNRIELDRTSSFIPHPSSLTEWYENGPQGLEQGLTIPSAPGERTGESRLRVAFELEGNLQARLANAGQALDFYDSSGKRMLIYDRLMVTDAKGQQLAALITLEAGQAVLEIDDSEAMYPVKIDPTFAQQAKLTASDGAAVDQFGYSVSVSDETAVIGSGGSDIGANSNQGSAYVFVRTGKTWNFQQKLVASDGAASDLFGSSVVISGETVIVGVPQDDIVANSNQGSAYVFVKTGMTWSEQQKLTASNGAASDEFGNSVAISGETVVVGTWQGDIEANIDQGAAYVYVRTGTAWNEQQKLTASDGAEFDQFGYSVSVSGETVVVGAFQGDIGIMEDEGSAYVFVRMGTTWNEQQKLTASDGAEFDQFGISVSVSGETMVIGARRGDVGANSDQGAAYVFARMETTWSEQQKLTASDGAANDQFGQSVAISGETVVVGAFGDDNGAITNQGSAYRYVRVGTMWSEQQKLTASDGAEKDNLGYSVAISGETVVVGAFTADIGDNADQGSAYVFVLGNVDCSTITGMVTGDGTICAGSSFTVTVTVTGGTAPYTVTLDNGGGTQSGSSPLIFSVFPEDWSTTYSVESGADALGCPITGSGSATVTVSPDPPAYAGPDQTVCGLLVRLEGYLERVAELNL